MKKIEEFSFISKNLEEKLSKSLVFKNVKKEDIAAMLMCLDASYYEYDKNETIIDSTKGINKIGLIINGEVSIYEEDINGNRVLFKTISDGDLFGESFVCAKETYFPMTVESRCSSIIMFLKSEKIFSEDNFCRFQAVLIKNLLSIVAKENVFNNRRLSNTMHKTTKEKLLAYLHDESRKNNSDSFRIAYNRQQLADYLGVERSALSVVISELVKNKIINSNKNHFELLKNK